MEKTKNKTKIDAFNFNNILELINSEDEKSNLVGLSILENSDINKSYIYLLLLYNKWTGLPKYTNDANIINAKKNIINDMKSFDNDFDEDFVSYKFIYSYMKENKEKILKYISKEEFMNCEKFVIKNFKTELVTLLKNFDYDIFNDYNLIITKKI